MSPVLNVSLAVDVVTLTVLDDQLAVLVVERTTPPFKDRLALPGGSVLVDEDLADAAERILWERTGLEPVPTHLEQVATYATPGRDPRGRVATVAYLAVIPALSADLTVGSVGSGEGEGGPARAAWVAAEELLDDPRSLAFDHHRILDAAVERARSKLEDTPLATAFCPDEFTIGDLRRIYEAVWGVTIDPRNFHRKVSGTADLLVETGRITSGEGGRPARLFRRGEATLLYPSLLRPD